MNSCNLCGWGAVDVFLPTPYAKEYEHLFALPNEEGPKYADAF